MLATDDLVDTWTMETHSPPCGHSTHNRTHVRDDPAVYYIRGICPACGDTRRFLLCESGWQAGKRGLHCHVNNQHRFARDKCWTIIGKV